MMAGVKIVTDCDRQEGAQNLKISCDTLLGRHLVTEPLNHRMSSEGIRIQTSIYFKCVIVSHICTCTQSPLRYYAHLLLEA